MTSPYDTKHIKIRALHNDVIISSMHFGDMKTASGLIIRSDDGKAHGIKPRWGQVYKVGPNQTDVKVGQWILVEHGRWTRGVKVEIDDIAFTVRRVDADAILAVSDEQPNSDDILSSALVVDQKTR
jgi:hypothetical protein